MKSFWLTEPVLGARLGVATRPRGGDWLRDDLASVESEGCNILISLLTPSEEKELELECEAATAAELGLKFVRVPVEDRGIPSGSEFRERVLQCLHDLEAGHDVLAHCRQGIGRSAMFLAAVLVASGETCDRAWARIASARGRDVPDTPEQRDWVRAAQAWGR